MKYDNDEDPKDTAETCKLEGNKHFKLKKYRWAVDAYTNGERIINSIQFTINCNSYHIELHFVFTVCLLQEVFQTIHANY